MQIAKFLAAARDGERELSDALLMLSNRHAQEPEMRDQCKLLATWSKAHVAMLKPLIDHYGDESTADPNRLSSALFHGNRVGGVGMIRDLQDVSALATHLRLTWTALYQAAKSFHDKDLAEVADRCGLEIDRQIAWFCTALQHASPQAMIVPAGNEPALPNLAG